MWREERRALRIEVHVYRLLFGQTNIPMVSGGRFVASGAHADRSKSKLRFSIQRDRPKATTMLETRRIPRRTAVRRRDRSRIQHIRRTRRRTGRRCQSQSAGEWRVCVYRVIALSRASVHVSSGTTKHGTHAKLLFSARISNAGLTDP